jgi:Multiubiquitin
MAEQQDDSSRPTFRIQIDREHYEVHKEEMTGEELRHVPTPPIGPDFDLFEVVPGEPDRKIELHTVVKISNGKRFFTAPAHINPGQHTN